MSGTRIRLLSICPTNANRAGELHSRGSGGARRACTRLSTSNTPLSCSASNTPLYVQAGGTAEAAAVLSVHDYMITGGLVTVVAQIETITFGYVLLNFLA